MGVLSVLRDLDDIAREAGSGTPVVAMSCNNCVRGCGCGGEMHLDRICDELEARGVRIEERLLVTNPCSRGYLESYRWPAAARKAIVFACPGTQAGLKDLHPELDIVAGVDSLGLMVTWKAKGRIKLVAPFPGYEDQVGAEFEMGNTSVRFDDQQLALGR